ncbi:MAG: hypothetical protein ABSG59_04495 [Verrucomicrobiota bacterium]|jgi:hypothetical protein
MTGRRAFLKRAAAAAAWTALPGALFAADAAPTDWLERWQNHILAEARNRYCDTEMGEELGWLVSPFLNGFYYGWRATGDSQWLQRLADWAGAWIRRGVTEPDGFTGWPKKGTGGIVEENFLTDSLLGEAMALRPLVLAAGDIVKSPPLHGEFLASAQAWLDLAERTFAKWIERGCWREVPKGGVWVVPDFGLDAKTNGWTDGYARRTTGGFSNPANKQNLIALWLIALSDATQKPRYRDHAQMWWGVMKSRIRARDDGKYVVWNYWDPAGPWDYRPDGSTRHWVGVHPNGGYYEIDVQAMVAAFDHGLVFKREDLQRLVATNRDFMWNQQVAGAKFRRIDGGLPDPRWKDSPGVLWTALVPYDQTLRRVFVANHNPASWGGLAVTPWFLARMAGRLSS